MDDLVSAYLADSAVELPSNRAVKALVRQDYDIYAVGMNDFVQNAFSMNRDLATTPLLGIRILQLLSDVVPDEPRETLMDTDQIEAYFTAMGVENRAVRLWLDAMLKSGLILDYDPTVASIDASNRLEVSPSGRQHMYWATNNYEYLNGMMEVTPLLSETVFSDLTTDSRNRVDWHKRTAKFITYLLDEDAIYCQVPTHEAYQGQRRLRGSLGIHVARLAEWPSSRRAGTAES